MFARRRRRLHRIIGMWLGAAILLVGVATLGHALDQSYTISSYRVTLELLDDGTYSVTEEIAYDYQAGTFTFGTRSIPTDKVDRLNDVEVTGSDTQVLETTTRTEDERKSIRWTFPECAEPATFTLSYSVHGALIEDDDLNRIDWQALGQETTVRVSNVAISVRILNSLDLTQEDLDFQPSEESQIRETSEGYAIDFEHAQLDSGQGYRVIGDTGGAGAG